MAKSDVQKVIDKQKVRSTTSSISIGGGGTSVDLSPYLLLDGSRAMTGNLSMGNFSIINVSLVDGVDIPGHVADANAHHTRLHDLDGASDHSGTLSWAKVNKSGSDITDIVTRAHQTLQSVGPNDHHNQQHSIIGTDHTVVGSTLDVIGLGGTNALAVLTPSFSPGATAKILKTDADGSLTIKKLIGTDFVKSSAYIEATTYVSAPTYLYTPSIQHVNNVTLSPTVDVVLNPGSNLVKLQNGKAFRTESFASGFAGNGFQLDQGITTGSITTLQIDDLFVRGRMHVYELIIQQIRATNGSIFVSSTGKAQTVTFVSGSTYRITTDGETPHGFFVGDLIRAQRTKWNGSTFAGLYQSNMQVTVINSLYSFDATLSSGDVPLVGYEFVRLGSASNSNRKGSIYLTSDDASAPFIDILNDVDDFSDWNTAAVSKMRIGKLDGITGGTNEYGFVAGQGGYSDSVKYIKASNYGIRLNNVALQLWSASTQRVNFDDAGVNVWFKDASGNTKLSWNGSTLSVVGAITVTGGDAAKIDFSNITATLENLGDGATYKRTTANEKSGAGYAYTGLNSSGYVKNPVSGAYISTSTPPTAGFNITATNTGYWNGSAWKVYFDNAGNFYFGGASGASLRWDGTKLSGYNSSGVEQWWAGSSGGAISAGGGNVTLDSNGIIIYRPIWEDTSGTPEPTYGILPNTNPAAYTTLNMKDTDSYWVHTYPAQVVSGTYSANQILRMYVSSKHLIPTAEEWGSWNHYYDSVFEMPYINLGSFGGNVIKRMWFKGAYQYTFQDGVVGVGTANPSTLLHLVGTNPAIRVESSSVNQTPLVDFYDTTTRKGTLIYAGGNSAGSKYFGFINWASDYLGFFSNSHKISNLSGNAYISITSSSIWMSPVSNTTDFVINASNQVGIGVSSISEKLDVGSRIRSRTSGSNTGGLLVSDSSGTNRGFVGLHTDSASSKLGFYNAGAWRLLIDASGNTMIGTESQYGSAFLSVAGAIWATGAITTEQFIQIKETASAPAYASGYTRIWMRSSDGALVATMESGTDRQLAAV